MAGPRAEFLWRGEDERGREQAHGVYLVRAELGGFDRTEKVVW
jgi:hypothetical protein